MKRDFTYIDDIVEGVVRTADRPAAVNPHWNSDSPDPGTSNAPYRIYNIGNHHSVELSHFVSVLEQAIGKTAHKILSPMQPGDVPVTYADIDDLRRDVDFQPRTSIEEGIPRFVAWYREYHGV
jgi:UDP-glucuronate 4-epimerase